MINWFKNINNKKTLSFVNFDVESLYPSILIDLFTDPINYAKTIKTIDDNQFSVIIIHSREYLIFNNNKSWVKKTEEKTFDVMMCCYNGADVCELERTHILNKIKMLQTMKPLFNILMMDWKY